MRALPTLQNAHAEPAAGSLLAPLDGRYKPSPADFERVEAKLRDALSGGTPQSRPTSSSTSRLVPWLGLSCVALVTIGLALRSHRLVHANANAGVESPIPSATTKPPPEATHRDDGQVAEQTSTPEISIDALPEAPAAPSPKTGPPPQRLAAKPVMDDDDDALAREARLLARAESAFRSGNDDGALALLDQHAREFPHGLLEDERLAERVIVLCHTGRVEQAVREGRAFLRARVSDPLARRVAMSCAGAPATEAP